MSILKEAREKAGYSIGDVSAKLNIRRKYILAIEEERFDELPNKVYLDGYIKIYKNFLHIQDDDNTRDVIKTQYIMDNNKILDNIQYGKLLVVITTVILCIIFLIYCKY